ncbi:unnamed protein product [Ilex paraguariensis]|uniref:Uncharacterized protein n=1 Tax=Ilex paraguariensis TaxID=185542 RepID=A0ABC8SKY5_9AQUA
MTQSMKPIYQNTATQVQQQRASQKTVAEHAIVAEKTNTTQSSPSQHSSNKHQADNLKTKQNSPKQSRNSPTPHSSNKLFAVEENRTKQASPAQHSNNNPYAEVKTEYNKAVQLNIAAKAINLTPLISR